MTGTPGELHRLADRSRLLATDIDRCARELRTGADTAHWPGAGELRRRLRRRARTALAGADRLRHAAAGLDAYARALAAARAHQAELSLAAARRRAVQP